MNIKKFGKKFPCVSTVVIISVFTGLLLSGDSFGAVDGELGPSSTGQMRISVTVQDTVRIHQLSDIEAILNEHDTINDANAKFKQVDACVYSSGGAYTLMAQNTNGSENGYAFLRGNEHQLPYQLAVSDNNNQRYSNILTSGKRMMMQGATDLNCRGGKNLHISMRLPNNAVLNPDRYQDVVNLTVAPV